RQGGGLRPGRAGPRGRRPPSDAAPRLPEYLQRDPRPGDRLDSDRDHRRSDPVVPGPGRAAARPVLGDDAQRCAAVPGDGALDGVLAWAGDLLARAVLQPRRRRAAGPARPQGLLTPTLVPKGTPPQPRA